MFNRVLITRVTLFVGALLVVCLPASSQEQDELSVDDLLTIQLYHLGISNKEWLKGLNSEEKQNLSITLSGKSLEGFSYNQSQVNQLKTLSPILDRLEDPKESKDLIRLMRIYEDNSQRAIVRPVVGIDEAELILKCVGIEVPAEFTRSNVQGIPNDVRKSTSLSENQNTTGFKCNKNNAKRLGSYLVKEGRRNKCIKYADFILKQEATHASIISDYLSYCGVKDISASYKKNKNLNDLVSRVGVFINKKEGVFCTGFLLNSKTIVTARHCNSYKGKDNFLSDRGTRFEFYGEISEKHSSEYDVEDSACSYAHELPSDQTMQSCDYLTINLENEIPNIESVRYLERAKLFDSLFPIGYHYYKHLDAYNFDLESLGLLDASTWKKGIIGNELPTCSVYGTKEVLVNGKLMQCLKHGCQTVGGMSGSPIFGLGKNGELGLIAIHIGSNATKTETKKFGRWSSHNSCGFESNPDAINYRNVAISFGKKL